MFDLKRLQRSIVRSPFIWGGLAAAGFYSLIQNDVLSGDLVQRYFSSHPVEYVATTMFFLGLALLAVKVFDLVRQYPQLSKSLLGPVSPSGRAVGDAQTLLAKLDELPSAAQYDYLPRRLRQALLHVRRRGSADMLDEQLKFLADMDAGRLHSSFALVRVINWAIPILGFLGTVIGITLAIANLAPEALENSLPEVTAGLGVAFDTTTVALGLSIVLMFAQSLTAWAESSLLERVDERVEEELEGRFVQISSSPEGQVEAVRRMGESLVQTTQRLVERQVELWRNSLDDAAGRWSHMADATGEQLKLALSEVMNDSLATHAERLVSGEKLIAESNRQHWNLVQQAQVQNTQAVAALQSDMTRQAEVLMRAVEATGEVAGLETSLNRNLAALAGAKNFEQTVMSLAAAIHLLNSRLGELPEGGAVRLDPENRAGQAA